MELKLIKNTHIAEEYITKVAKKNNIRLTEKQRTRAIDAVEQLINGTDGVDGVAGKPSDYLLRKILEASSKV